MEWLLCMHVCREFENVWSFGVLLLLLFFTEQCIEGSLLHAILILCLESPIKRAFSQSPRSFTSFVKASPDGWWIKERDWMFVIHKIVYFSFEKSLPFQCSCFSVGNTALGTCRWLPQKHLVLSKHWAVLADCSRGIRYKVTFNRDSRVNWTELSPALCFFHLRCGHHELGHQLLNIQDVATASNTWANLTLWLVSWISLLELIVFVCLFNSTGITAITDNWSRFVFKTPHFSKLPVQAVLSGLWGRDLSWQGFVEISRFPYLSLIQASVASLIPWLLSSLTVLNSLPFLTDKQWLSILGLRRPKEIQL